MNGGYVPLADPQLKQVLLPGDDLAPARERYISELVYWWV